MSDWYVYHSAKTMGRRYGHPQPNHVFSTSVKRKLCLNDKIWVIEGVGDSPKMFYFAACFVYKETEYPPFPYPYKGGKYADFEVMYSGPGTSYDSRFNLTFEDHPWFKDLHKIYITKRKFFDDISTSIQSFVIAEISENKIFLIYQYIAIIVVLQIYLLGYLSSLIDVVTGLSRLESIGSTSRLLP